MHTCLLGDVAQRLIKIVLHFQELQRFITIVLHVQELLNELDVQQHVSPQSSQSDVSEIQPALQASHSTSVEPHIHQQSHQQYPALHNKEPVAAAQHQSSLYTQNEIQPANGFSSLQLPDRASQNDRGWFAQTQAWATALYNSQVPPFGLRRMRLWGQNAPDNAWIPT